MQRSRVRCCASGPVSSAWPPREDACGEPPLRDAVTGRDEVVAAGWTVGADGTRSIVSRLVGADRDVRFPRRIGLVAHYSGIGELTDHGEMHVGPGYYVGLAPTPGGELNVGMALPMDRGSAADASRRPSPACRRSLAGSPAAHA